MEHHVGPIFKYAQEGCLVDVGHDWTKEEIITSAQRGPHISALDPEAIAIIRSEVEDKVREGFAEIVTLDKIEHLLGTDEWVHLKILPLAMVPHKSRHFRAVLDTLFQLRLAGMIIPSVNDDTVVTVPQHSMRKLGSVLPHLIEAVAVAPEGDDDIMFSKLDIKTTIGAW